MARRPATKRSRPRRCGSTTPPAPTRAWSSTRKLAWDRALAPRRAARLSQCAGDRDRADRHDRPRHGLRHHRHRARLRAGEVQEARRRRLFQDHQPRRAGGAARARLFRRGRSPTSRPMRSATARSPTRPASITPRCKAKGFTPEAIERLEKALPTAFDISFAFNKWTLGEEFCTDALGLRRRGPRQARLRHARRARLFPARDRRGECACVRRDDGRGRAASARRALCRVRLRQSVRAQRQALPLGRQPHPHDGGGAALHLRRDLQDHQHAERGDGRGLQAGLSAVVEARAEGERALSRRLEALAAAAEPAHRRRGGRRGRHRGLRREAGGGARRRARGEGGREGGRAHRRHARARAHARPPQGLHPEGRGRRAQGLSAHRRIRRRPARRNLHRHAQGGRGAPLPDEQFRDRGLARPAIWRAARGVCRRLHLHPLRAERPGAGQRLDQIRHLDPRLCLPRARGELSRPLRPRPCRPDRGGGHFDALGKGVEEGKLPPTAARRPNMSRAG